MAQAARGDEPAALAGHVADLRRGQLIFKKSCAQCHSIKPEGRGKVLGPNLFGVIGSPSGTLAEAWGSKNPRLKSLNFVWTEANMKLWLTNPQAVGKKVWGDKTCMSFKGMEEEDRDDLVGFIRAVPLHFGGPA